MSVGATSSAIPELVPGGDLPPGGIGAVSRRPRRVPPTLVAGAVLLALVVGITVVSLFWTPFPLGDTSGSRLEPPGPQHWLGTDTFGRDSASHIMVGTRIALEVGLGAAAIAVLLGLVLGLSAAFASGWLDDINSSLLDIVIAFPTLLLAMLIGATRGASVATAIVSIGIAASAVVARFARILAKRLLRQQFVIAARTSGTGWPGIIGHHLLPNLWPSMVVNAALMFGAAVLTEASLSYLGLGVPPPNASLGRLLQEAQGTVLVAPWAAIAPGAVIVLIVLGANFLADGLRELADPTRRER